MSGPLRFEVVDIPRWKEKCIYTLLWLLGYRTAEWMLLEQIKKEDE